jgi:hypothetical protein
MGWPFFSTNWITVRHISSCAGSVDTWCEVSVCEKVVVNWPYPTFSESSTDSRSFESNLPHFHIMLDKLISWNLLQMLFHIIITSFCLCMCKGTKNADIKRLELVGCMWRK